MSLPSAWRPRLPSHYYVFCEPPDDQGEETLHIVSERRRLKLRGRMFREFEQQVIPLLDGRRNLGEIEQQVADIFAPADLEAGLEMLAAQGVLEDGAAGDSTLEPQANLFHELGLNAREAQEKLNQATVAVFGLGGAGTALALGLHASGLGKLRLVDDAPVTPADTFLSPVFTPADLGQARAEALRKRLPNGASAHSNALQSDEEVAAVIHGCDYLVCCLDPGRASLIYRLNRACLAEKLRWISCTSGGLEAVIGPAIRPYETACYLCYKMRAVACAEDPESEFAFQRFLDRRKQDDTQRIPQTIFAAHLAAQLTGLELLKELVGTGSRAAGSVLVLDLLELSLKRYVVLRKPWCPACFAGSPP